MTTGHMFPLHCSLLVHKQFILKYPIGKIIINYNTL